MSAGNYWCLLSGEEFDICFAKDKLFSAVGVNCLVLYIVLQVSGYIIDMLRWPYFAFWAIYAQ